MISYGMNLGAILERNEVNLYSTAVNGQELLGGVKRIVRAAAKKRRLPSSSRKRVSIPIQR